jgi:RimJ/RimL family protein N-acetyltransferase
MDAPASLQITRPLEDATTDRLRLVRVSPADTDDLAAVFAEPAVWKFPFGRGMDAAWTAEFVARAVEHWQRFGFGLWTVRTRSDDAAIGYLGLSMPAFLAEAVPAERMPAVEIGWRLHPDYWGNGLATEGAGAALQGAFETLELTEVCSAPQSINPPSARVAERIGMRHERTMTLVATSARGPVDIDLYWITREHWLTNN